MSMSPRNGELFFFVWSLHRRPSLAMLLWGVRQSGIGVDRVVNITLPEWVAVVKSAARRSCSVCGRGFNVADVNEGERISVERKKGEL